MYLKRLKDLREDSDLTQEELATKLNLTQRAYSHYENGNRDIPLEVLIKVADIFDVTVDYLLERTNEK